MKISRLKIENFRGIKKAELYFDSHTLLVGGNNIGKSTICEAIDLVLGTDRLNGFPAIEEYDFYNGRYLDEEDKPVPLTIEAVLTNVSEEVLRRCGNYIEFWHTKEKRLLEQGEIKAVDSDGQPCLRIMMLGKYNPDEDEFEAGTFYSHSPDADEGELTTVSKAIKRLFGFLYLRTLRTGTRALSLERGSLLDIILRIKEVRAGFWEKTRRQLQGMETPAGESKEIPEILKEIEHRLGEYIPLTNKENTKLFISKLTREHLRKTISFFLSMSANQTPVPFQQVGTGTLNTLVLALLTFIAEIKEENVIFAMEEPEIALPPHTQRRIVNYLLNKTTQCFVTTHSPYIIESFSPSQITVLNRDDEGTMCGKKVDLSCGLKLKTYRKHIRRGLAEAILSEGVVIAEGITELYVLQTVAQMMEENDNLLPKLDLAGITMLSADGDGSLSEFGQFFKSLNIPSFAFFDKKKRPEEEETKRKECFDIVYEIEYTGMEELLIKEVSLDHQWAFLCEFKSHDIENKLGIPSEKPGDENTLRLHTKKVLKAGKGEGRAVELIQLCSIAELPISITRFLSQVYNKYISEVSEEGAPIAEPKRE